MPNAADVQVFGFEDFEGNLGISFHGVFQDLPGGGPSDALIRYTVAVSPEGLELGNRISDAHLYLGGIGVGPGSYLLVDESFQGINQTLNGFQSTLGGPLVEQLSDWVYFDELHTKIRVTKDILAFANADSSLPARVSVVDQSFSQEVIPEPSTILIFGTGGLALTYWRRRQS